MPSPDVLDFAKLLAPIPGDKAVGVDLRTDPSPTSPYYVIKDARSAARAIERQVIGGEDANSPRPDWRPVIQHGNKVLAEKSKDLEITAYMIESLVRINSFAGLRDGFRLARELCEKYWDNLYPLPDEEGIETRVAALTGLNGEGGDGTLIGPITWVPLTDSPNLGRLSLANFKEAGNLDKVTDPKAREKKIAAGALSMEMFEKAVAETPKPFYATLMDDLTRSMEEFTKLTAELTKRCGDRSPPSSAIRDSMVAVQDIVKSVAKNKLDIPAAAAGPAADGEAAGAAPGQAAAAGPGQAMDVLRTREDALRILLKVGEYFRRTEPHNPVSYVLEQAVRWSQMALPELLTELIPAEEPRKGLFKQVGIKPPEPPPKETPAKK
jgi:type VI secretion system protein ImpA